MPTNRDFTVNIHVGGRAVPEYRRDGRYLVECNLDTEVSYKQTQSEIVNGERETQNWPVTPYEIELTAHPSLDSPHYFRVLVDGVKVKGISLEPGTTQMIKGFRDGGCIREFLFSMPRFAQDVNDRLPSERVNAVGKIEVQCWKAVLRKTKRGRRRKHLEFEQANKKDASAVTQGQYTMTTSKAGRVVCSRSIFRCVDNWKLIGMQSEIHIEYHMAHTLRDMGLALQPITCDPEYVAKNRRLPTADGTSGLPLRTRPVNAEVELIDLTGDDSDEENGAPKKKLPKSELVEVKQEPELVMSVRSGLVVDLDDDNPAPITVSSQSQEPPVALDIDMPESNNRIKENSQKSDISDSAKENQLVDEAAASVGKAAEKADDNRVVENIEETDATKGSSDLGSEENEKTKDKSMIDDECTDKPAPGVSISRDQTETSDTSLEKSSCGVSDKVDSVMNGSRDVDGSAGGGGGGDVVNEVADMDVEVSKGVDGAGDNEKNVSESDKVIEKPVNDVGGNNKENTEVGAGDGVVKEGGSADDLLAEMDSIISQTAPKDVASNGDKKIDVDVRTDVDGDASSALVGQGEAFSTDIAPNDVEPASTKDDHKSESTKKVDSPSCTKDTTEAECPPSRSTKDNMDEGQSVPENHSAKEVKH